MKQILQNFQTGELEVHDVPLPLVQSNGVLVRTHYSLISSGTEGGTVRLAKVNLLEKARQRPELVKKVMDVVRTDGLKTAYDVVTNNLGAPIPLGYSLSGVVIAVGEGITDLQVGDKVACFGSMVANHAEYNFIPRNMCVRLDDAIDMQLAAFCMLGAISMNGIRRAKLELGSNVLVIGLGLLGQLTVQLLKASGCHVFGVDLDPHKVELAKQSGAEVAVLRSEDNLQEMLRAFSDGVGMDATIITAATDSTDPVELAGQSTRQRGMVIAIGRIPYELPRETYFYKELEFATTWSYGPGVMDPNYEKKGLDYPVTHVRWSGQRNVQSVIKLIADNRLNLMPLITHEFSIDQAEQAFSLLTGENAEPSLAIMLRYSIDQPYLRARIPFALRSSGRGKKVRPGIGLIGAGSHTVSFLFDAINALDVEKRGIVSAGGFKAKWYGEKYGFAYAAADPQDLFDDESLNAVFILSRHDSHADLTLRALKHGKDVFVEKPLCLTPAELDAIIAAQGEHGRRVMVGYNRRFAPMGVKLYNQFQNHAQPLSMIYRFNAGYRPADHWMHDPELGGGVIIGEGVHFIDFLQWVVGAMPVRVWAQAMHSPTKDVINADSLIINVQYADGSISAMHYLSNGDKSIGRERIEIYGDSTVGILEDWRSLLISKNGKQQKERGLLTQDKGFNAEIAAFVSAVRDDQPLPTRFEELVAGMRVAFGALESLRSGQSVQL